MLPQGPLYQRSVRLKIKLLLKPFYILESTISLQKETVLATRHDEGSIKLMAHNKLASLEASLKLSINKYWYQPIWQQYQIVVSRLFSVNLRA